MSMLKYLALVLLIHSTLAFAITRQDLEQIKSELDNPITLETVETALLESGLPFMKAKGQKSCSYYYAHSESNVKTFKIGVDFHSYAGKEILHRIDWGSDYAYYEIVDGRFRSSDSYYRYAGVSDSVKESRDKLMYSFNAILDKIENGKKLYWPHSGRCENCAIQVISLYSLSGLLGSRGVCNGGYGSEIQTCNYRVALDGGSFADVSVEYMSSARGDDYTPVSIRFNDKQGVDDGLENANPIKIIKIGKQEWMDHNLLYGEGLTAKYGVGDGSFSESYSVPSGEVNSWFVFMDLNLRAINYNDYTEKPNITENHQGACPAGFHVPTIAEWKELFSFVAKDKVKFPKYELFEAYEKAVDALPNNFELAFASASDLKKIQKQQKKLESIEKELDAAYNKWRKGRKDGFNCNNGEKCRYNKYDMRNRIDEEIINHLCTKGAWPFDENGEEMCFDSYGFSMPSNSKTGNDMSYWAADAEISKCHDVFDNGRHQCTYDISGYGFSVKNEWQKFRLSKFEKMLGNANLRCLKNRSKK